MKDVLLVLTSPGAPEEAIDYALDRAKKSGAGLVALFLVEAGVANEVFDTFSDIGFTGDRPSAQLSEALLREYRERGREELDRVKARAERAGVAFDSSLDQGDYVTKVLGEIKGRQATLAVLVRRKTRRLFKYFSLSLADEVKVKAPCEVVVFAEG
jgi:nucleotide-binding universal stress UspA family protein